MAINRTKNKNRTRKLHLKLVKAEDERTAVEKNCRLIDSYIIEKWREDSDRGITSSPKQPQLAHE